MGYEIIGYEIGMCKYVDFVLTSKWIGFKMFIQNIIFKRRYRFCQRSGKQGQMS